jgi:hypothetical protein
MPSSSDYILAKKIVAIKKDLINSSIGDNNCYYNCNSTVIGDDYDCRQTVSGDRYLTIFSETIHKYVINTGSIGIQLEPGLAYTHGQNIVCVSNTSIAPYDSFKGSVMSYNADTGIIVINKIHDISEGFIYSTSRSYKLNIDNSSENLNISLDNQTDTPCYPNFLPASQGQFTNPRTSQYMTFTPTNGELSVNTLYETTNATTRKNIQDLETSYAVNFIKQLKPKKFTYLKQENIKRFGLLSEDIPKTFQNEQLGVSNNANGVAYSELIAPIISSMNMIFDKLDNLEARFSQMEDTVKNMQNMAPLINPTLAMMSTPPPVVMETPQTFADEVLTPNDEVLTPNDEVLTPNDEVLTPNDEVLPQDIRIGDYFKLDNYFNMKQNEIATPTIDEPFSIEQENNDDTIEIDNVMDLVHLIAEAKKKYNK